jgi:putative inorganic carbon (HCO3(-)) transporter
MPRWLVPLWVFLLPLQFHLRGLFPRLAPSDLVLVAYVPHFLSSGLRAGRGFWDKSITALAVSVILLGNIAFFFSTGQISRWALLNKGVGLLVLMLSYVMVGEYASAGWDRIHNLIRWFTRAVALNALIAIVAKFLGWTGTGRIHMNWGGGARLAGFFVDPNAFGGLLVSALVIALVVYFRKGPMYKPVEGFLTCGVLAVGTFLTYSRSSWIGLVAGVVVGFLLSKARHRVLGVVIILMLGGAIYYATPVVLQTETQSQAWEQSQVWALNVQSIEHRVDIVKEGIEFFRQSPIWGKGLGYYLSNEGILVHNTVVWILAELGLIGAAAFAWFIIAHFRRAAFNIRYSRERLIAGNVGLLCGFVALVGLSIGIEALYQRHWWLVMALISAGYVMAKRELAAATATNRRPAYGPASRAGGTRPPPRPGSPVGRALTPWARR